MKRIKYIDAIKGFAIILVVVGHVANGYINAGITNPTYRSSLNFTYAFHMPLFFTVSGFLYRQVYFEGIDNIRTDKLNRQIGNLICIYFIHSFILCLLKIVFRNNVVSDFELKDLLMIPIRPFDIFWYIYTLVLCYIIFRIERVRKLDQRVLFAITLLLSIASKWIPASIPLGIKSVAQYAFYFYMGIIIRNHQEILQNKKIVLPICLLVISFFNLFWNNSETLNNIWLVNLVIGGGTTVCAFSAFKRYRILHESKVLGTIGKYSLEIYVFHTYFVTGLRTVFNRIQINNPLIILMISSISGVMFPMLFTLFIKRIGLYKFIFNPIKKMEKSSIKIEV